MKKYVRSNLSTEVHKMSKERLESVVSQIARIVSNDTISTSNRIVEISYLLHKFNLR